MKKGKLKITEVKIHFLVVSITLYLLFYILIQMIYFLTIFFFYRQYIVNIYEVRDVYDAYKLQSTILFINLRKIMINDNKKKYTFKIKFKTFLYFEF